jgi:ABC-2 type transport system ATP-binding protein
VFGWALNPGMGWSTVASTFSANPRLGAGADVLSVRGLCREYPPKRAGLQPVVANDHLTLTVGRGEIVALLGPNGAGKSTFLKQVAGQLRPTSGEITVAGVDMVEEPRKAKETLSIVPQECSPSGSYTVEEFVLLFGRLKGLPHSEAPVRVREVLEEAGLASERLTLIRHLSGGYKRRVLIAAAMAGLQPKLMLLDEPTTGLDPEARRSVWKVVHQLRERGLGILLTTHYIEEAEALADRLVIIDAGRFIAMGSVREIRDRLPFRGRIEIRDLDRLPPALRQRAEALTTRWSTAFRGPSLVRLHVEDPFAPETVEALRQLVAMGVYATLGPSSLEDAYIALLGHEKVGP